MAKAIARGKAMTPRVMPDPRSFLRVEKE